MLTAYISLMITPNIGKMTATMPMYDNVSRCLLQQHSISRRTQLNFNQALDLLASTERSQPLPLSSRQPVFAVGTRLVCGNDTPTCRPMFAGVSIRDGR